MQEVANETISKTLTSLADPISNMFATEGQVLVWSLARLLVKPTHPLGPIDD